MTHMPSFEIKYLEHDNSTNVVGGNVLTAYTKQGNEVT